MSIHDLIMVLLGMIIAEIIYVTVDYMDYSRARRAFFSDLEAAMKNVAASRCECDQDEGENGKQDLL